MLSSLAEIMDEIAATLSAVIGEDTNYGCQVTGRMNFNPTPPSVDVYPALEFRTEDEAGFGEVSGRINFVVRARSTTADNEAGQDVLLALMDDSNDGCVAAILQEDQTLNGLVSSVDVDGPTGFARYDDSGGEGALLGVEWTVGVLNVST